VGASVCAIPSHLRDSDDRRAAKRVGQEHVSNQRTVEDLFAFIDERIATADRVFVSYDQELGFPLTAYLGDISMVVPAFRPFSRLSEVADPFVLVHHVNHCGYLTTDPTYVGVCPDYSVAIWGDGTVMYRGERGVRTLGRRQHQATADGVLNLAQAIYDARFFELADDYRSVSLGGGLTRSVDHQPDKWITVHTGDRQKTVHDFYGAPDALHTLEDAIERITDSRRYTGRDK
jgi:hypothetical protein